MDWERVKGWLRREARSALGVRLQGEKIYMALAEQDEYGQSSLVWQEEMVRQKGQSARDFAEAACMRARQNIAGEADCYVVLDGQAVFYYEKDFPQLPHEELEQGARLDFAAVSAWQEPYVWDYEQTDGCTVRIGGILKTNLRERLAVWQEFFSCTVGVLCAADAAGCREELRELGLEEELSPGTLAAVYGAWKGVEHSGLRLSLDRAFLQRWNWLHLTAALWAISLGLMCAVGMGWRYYSGTQQEKLRNQQEQLLLMQDIAERKAAIDEDREIIERKNKMMEKLHGENLAGRGILVNIGKSMKEGIWLTGLSAQAGHKVILQGKAAGYSQVSGLMDELQRDKAFFQGKIFLSSTEADRDGLISFQMNGKL
ncbi:MAG: PilN domain-containing protein [Anaerovibrio sp.]|nr:PilN domain-containing protein [Anaerovibrio sp.]